MLDEGYSVKLAKNITGCGNGHCFPAANTDVTLDLNSYTMTQYEKNYLFELSTEGTGKLIITDTSSEKKGAIIGNGTTTGGDGGNFARVRASGRGLVLNAGTIRDFKLDNDSGNGGGAIKLWSGTTFTMNGGTISGCTCDNDGGAVYVGTNARFAMTGGTITDCSCNGQGGALFLDSDNGAMSGGTIKNCSASTNGGGVHNYYRFNFSGGTIKDCSAPLGGGVYSRYTGFYLNGGTISGCTATTSGGGVYNATNNFTMNSGTISGCKASSTGGGIYVAAGTVTMTGGTISGCEAKSSRGGGVAAAGSSAKFEMTGGTISGNTATGTTGGTGNGAGIVIEDSATGIIRGGSIKNNTANRYGGGILNNKGLLEVYGGEVSGNTATTGDGGGIQTDYTAGGTTSTKIYGGVVKGNTSSLGHSCLFANMTSSQNTTVYGGVFDKKPTSASYIGLGSGCAETQVGSLYVVGTGILGGCGKIVNGSLTFNPTAAEYVAAGVAPDSAKATTSGSGTSYSVAPKNNLVEVNAWSEAKAALEAGYSVKLTQSISQGSGKSAALFGKTVTLDLNGYTITGSSQTSYENRLAKLLEGSNLTLTDSSSAKTGMIDGQSVSRSGNGGCVYLYSGCTFTMNGGTITKYACSENGGAIYNGGTFALNGGMISGCAAGSSYNGGALYSSSNGVVTLKNGTISGCTAGRGGGVYVIAPSGTVAIENMTFSNNKATFTNGGYGGAINGDNVGGTYVLRNCTITGNSASYSGGAICVGQNVTVDIYDSTITGNESGQGGAIYLNNKTGNRIRIYGIVLANNTKGTEISDFKIDRSGAVTAYGGVYSTNPSGVTNLAIAEGYASTLVGNRYVVGKSVAFDSNNKLTAGTYTFCPTNAEYAAAGVALSPGSFTEKTGDLAWQILSGTPAGDNTWAYIEDGVCTVFGTGTTSTNGTTIGKQWASIKDVRIADGVTGLGTYFFHKFYNLTNVTIAASCTSLGEGALFRCLSLEQVTFEGTTPPELGENALPIRAAIKMNGDTPVVTMVPKVTVGGKPLTLQGSNDLSNWENVAAGNEKNYHFFRFVVP